MYVVCSEPISPFTGQFSSVISCTVLVVYISFRSTTVTCLYFNDVGRTTPLSVNREKEDKKKRRNRQNFGKHDYVNVTGPGDVPTDLCLGKRQPHTTVELENIHQINNVFNNFLVIQYIEIFAMNILH